MGAAVMRGRLSAMLGAVSMIALGIGVNVPAAHADDPPVTKVGGGGFGIQITNENGGVNVNPTPLVTIPDQGGQFYGYGNDKFLPLGSEIGNTVVYAFGSLDPAPDEAYAFVDSRVAHVSLAGVPQLTFAGIKSFCEWDRLGPDGSNQAFGATFVYYEGGVGGMPVPNEDHDLAGGGHYILNEQTVETFNGRGVIVVNGLHAFLTDGTEIIVASSSCDPLRPPVLGSTAPLDSRASVSPTTGGLVDGWNNAVITEDCFNGVDDNGDGNIDMADPGCQAYDFCEEDGIDHLFSTPAEGVASGYVRYRVLPTGVVPVDAAAYNINCTIVVPAEDLVDSILNG
jgi:hypothetical protein